MTARKNQSCTDSGTYGEQVAVDLLRQKKYKILHRNYKTATYEIDIIAKKRRRLYFIEVKYRSTSSFGYGHEYITPTKLQQMAYAAQRWTADHEIKNEYQLGVVSVDGDEATLFLDIWQ